VDLDVDPEEIDIFADDERMEDECFNGCKSKIEDNAQDSTFISNYVPAQHSITVDEDEVSIDRFLNFSIVKNKKPLNQIE